MSNQVLRLEHVRKDLGVGNQVANTIIPDLSLSINRGEFVTITGPSGSGKSTLLYMMGALDKPTSGRIYFDNQEISAMTEDELVQLRNLKVGFIYQFHFLLPEFSALENVMMPMQVAGLRTSQAEARARETLEKVGMQDKMSSRPNQLSGGQQQRVAVARALANKPLVLFGDEPTGSLDTKATDQVYALLRELNQEGQTIIYVTHDSDLASRAERRIHLVDGRVESDDMQNGAVRSAPDQSSGMPGNSI